MGYSSPAVCCIIVQMLLGGSALVMVCHHRKSSECLNTVITASCVLVRPVIIISAIKKPSGKTWADVCSLFLENPQLSLGTRRFFFWGAFSFFFFFLELFKTNSWKILQCEVSTWTCSEIQKCPVQRLNAAIMCSCSCWTRSGPKTVDPHLLI